jgi:hypothetical protein
MIVPDAFFFNVGFHDRESGNPMISVGSCFLLFFLNILVQLPPLLMVLLPLLLLILLIDGRLYRPLGPDPSIWGRD